VYIDARSIADVKTRTAQLIVSTSNEVIGVVDGSGVTQDLATINHNALRGLAQLPTRAAESTRLVKELPSNLQAAESAAVHKGQPGRNLNVQFREIMADVATLVLE
jgi:hypothetical protein